MPHSLTHLLHITPELQNLTHKLAQLEQMNQCLTATLGPTLAEHCRVANLRDGSLILSTTSPAWNHKLRFASLDLLTSLRQNPNWSGLKSIAVRVDYLPTESIKPQMTSLSASMAISAENARLIYQTAQTINCGKLAKSLQNLARRMIAKAGYTKKVLD